MLVSSVIDYGADHHRIALRLREPDQGHRLLGQEFERSRSSFERWLLD
jgi:hypothetical protein